jgi:hypothetical protein
MGSAHHGMFIAKLRKHGGFIVGGSGNEIILSRVFNRKTNRPISVVLTRNATTNRYTIDPCGSEYTSSASHFEYRGDVEFRWTRDKRVLKYLIDTLKAIKCWDRIENKDFLKVNDRNKKSKKDRLDKELNLMMHV